MSNNNFILFIATSLFQLLTDNPKIHGLPKLFLFLGVELFPLNKSAFILTEFQFHKMKFNMYIVHPFRNSLFIYWGTRLKAAEPIGLYLCKPAWSQGKSWMQDARKLRIGTFIVWCSGLHRGQ